MNILTTRSNRFNERYINPDRLKPALELPYGEMFDTPEGFLQLISLLPKGEHDSFGATPLNRARTLEQQIELETTLRRRTHVIFPDISLEIADHIQNTFAQRFHMRAEANDENYQTALLDGRQYLSIPGVAEMYEKAELGEASPAELLTLRSMKAIRSVELACLTHPYGNGIEMLEPMRDAVKTSVEFLGGTYDSEPVNVYKVKDIVKNKSTGEVLGYLMTRKRILGQMPDGTEIRERSSFLLRVDAASLIAQFGKDMEEALNSLESINALLHLDELSEELLENNQFSEAIPISSTIYAFNREDAISIGMSQGEKKRTERRKFAKKYPHLYAVSLGDTRPLEVEPITNAYRRKVKRKVAMKVMINKLAYLVTETGRK